MRFLEEILKRSVSRWERKVCMSSVFEEGDLYREENMVFLLFLATSIERDSKSLGMNGDRFSTIL